MTDTTFHLYGIALFVFILALRLNISFVLLPPIAAMLLGIWRFFRGLREENTEPKE